MKNIKSSCCNEEVTHFMDNRYICKKCNSKCSTYNRKVFINFLIASVIIIIAICLFSQNTKVNNYKINYKKVELKKSEDIELNDSSITNELIRLGCILPNVALAQIKQETGHYKSKLTYTHKNIVGIMKGNEYKSYNTYKECLSDYVRIQNMYLKQIHRKFAEDSTYIYKLKQIK